MNKSFQNYNFPKFLLNLKMLMIVGIIVHIFFTISIYIIGRFAVFPKWISLNGSMREDAPGYFARCEVYSANLSNGNYDFLITSNEQIHVRLYTLPHFLFKNILGSNILTFEFVNLPLFLLILFLIYKIGQTLFDTKVGIISAYVIIFFPSFILHTTQPLRESLFTVTFLLLLLQLIKLVKTSFNLPQNLILTFTAVLTFISLWFIRDSMLLVYLGMIFLSLILIVFTNFENKWKYKYNLISVFALLIFAVSTPKFFADYIPDKREKLPSDEIAINKFIEQQIRLGKPIYLRKVNAIRYGFSTVYRDAGSNIDVGYIFSDTFALIRYVPKAFAIGLFAPFPNIWLGEGAEFGKVGRILAGLETAIMYVFILFSFLCIFAKRRDISVIFAALTVLIGVTALGLVTINIGAIYRLRYVFGFVIIILGINGIFELKAILDKRKISVEVAE